MKEYWKNKFRYFSPDELEIIKEALMEVIDEYDTDV
jgi:hypothetical protein